MHITVFTLLFHVSILLMCTVLCQMVGTDLLFIRFLSFHDFTSQVSQCKNVSARNCMQCVFDTVLMC